MSATEEYYRIVLDRVAADQQPRMTAQLADLFGVSLEMAAQIVRSAPTVLLSRLGRQEAMALAIALSPLREAGAVLRIASGEDPSLPQVSWPSPPRLVDKALTAARSPQRSGVSLACPCCGARFSLLVQPEQETTVPAARAAPPPKAAGKPLPSPETETAQAPAMPDDIEGDDPLFAAPPSVGDTKPFQPPANLRSSELGAAAANAGGAAATRPAPAIKDDIPSANGARGPFNVIISNAADNPKAMALVKEILRLSEKDAMLLMQKSNLTVAQGVSRETAVKVASRFKAINVAVRITQLKGAS